MKKFTEAGPSFHVNPPSEVVRNALHSMTTSKSKSIATIAMKFRQSVRRNETIADCDLIF
jgi:hypothetical protein